MNWLIEEAEKIHTQKDRIILENPETVKRLDEKIKTVFWPFIEEELEKTGYMYVPDSKNLKIQSVWNGPDLGRSVTFMIFDKLHYPFFRASLDCSDHGFILRRDFSLGLSRNTKPEFIFRILSDEKFEGMPPSLSIEESHVYPEWDYYYHIKLEAGTGMGFGEWSLNNIAKANIESVIKDSISMYEYSMIDGFSTMNDVEEFLKIAYRVYEA